MNDPVHQARLLQLSDLARHKNRKLCSFIFKRVGNASVAADIAQDAFVQAIKGIDQFRGGCSLETWVHAIALNLIRAHFSQSRRVSEKLEVNDELAIAMTEASNGDHDGETRDFLLRILDEIERLPKDLAEALLLVAVDEKSYLEIAEIQAIPLGTVRSRIARARELLRERLATVPLSDRRATPGRCSTQDASEGVWLTA